MPRDQSPILPASVTVYFAGDPCVPTTVKTTQINTSLSLFVDPATGPSGFAGTKIFHDVCAGDGTQAGATALKSLAQQISKDFYGWRFVGFDRMYNGIINYELEAQTDIIEWSYRAGAIVGNDESVGFYSDCSTRTKTALYNGESEELQHALTGGCAGVDGGTVVYVPPASVSSGTLTLPKAALSILYGRLVAFPAGSDSFKC